MRTFLNAIFAYVNLYIVVCRNDKGIIGYGVVVRSWFFDEKNQITIPDPPPAPPDGPTRARY